MTYFAKRLVMALLNDPNFEMAAQWSFTFMGIEVTAKRVSDGTE